MRPELSLSEYRQFHRPRLPITVVTPKCPWQFQTRVITSEKKVKRGRVSTSADGSTVVGSYHAMMSAGAKGQNKIRNEADLSASFGDLVLLEYSEERPPLFMTKGMTCRIVNYYRGDRSRCPVSAGGGDRPLRKRHGDKAATKGTEPAGPSGRIERPPRLSGPNQYTLKSAADLIGVVSNANRKKTKEAAALEAKKAKETAIDMLPEGVTEILYQKVHGEVNRFFSSYDMRVGHNLTFVLWNHTNYKGRLSEKWKKAILKLALLATYLLRRCLGMTLNQLTF